YDPLVAADRDPERFLRPAADQPAASTMLFETWMQSEWRDFGDALVSASGNQNASAAFAATAQGLAAHGKAPALDGGAAGASARDGQGATGSMAGSAAVGTSSAPPTDESAVSGLAAALRSSGSFSFNLADGLTDSIARMDDLLRTAPRLSGGFGLQALLSRFLPHIAGGALEAASGSERLILPLSRYVRWTADRYFTEHGYYQGQHSRRHMQDRLEIAVNDSSRCSTPDSANLASNQAQSLAGSGAPEHMSSEQEAKLREQMEAFQFMYTRLFDVLQSVQRDNH
ncbi:hypothetical protein GGI02_005939, partial [Coemansia sp. RSA 2322]